MEKWNYHRIIRVKIVIKTVTTTLEHPQYTRGFVAFVDMQIAQINP